MASSGPLEEERASSNLTVAAIIGYVSDRGGSAAVERLLATARETRPMAVLLDAGNWTSQDQKVRLFEAAVEVLGDPDAPRMIGATILERQAGTALRLVLRALGSPASVCRSVAKASARFATNFTSEALTVERDGAVISNRLHDGYEPNQYDCDYTAGVLSQIPALFGLEPAVVVHEECQVRGAPACVYRLRWRPQGRWRIGRKRHRIAFLEEERRLLTERYEALQSTIVDLVSPADVDTVLQRITRRAADAIQAQSFLLALRDESGGSSFHHLGLSVDDAEKLAAEVLADDPDDRGGSRLIVDVASSRRFYGRLVAVYGIEHVFFADDRRLFAAYARQAAMALESATALEEARRRGESASALLDLSRRLTHAATSDEVAQQLADAVPAVIGAHRASVLWWDPETEVMSFRTRSLRNILPTPGLSTYTIALSDTPVLADMVRTLQPQHVTRTTADPYLLGQLEAAGAEEMVAVPIQSGGELLGAVTALRNSPMPATDRAALAERLEGLADQAALAFEKVRLLEQERAAVRRLRRNEQRIRHMAYRDALTDLPNRRHFSEALERSLHDAEVAEEQLALLFCDLDRFKNVNDSLGHAQGDALLRAAAARLKGTVRHSDTLARLGGDEFTLLVHDVSGPGEAEETAERILAALRDPFRIDGQELFLSASVGVALYPEDGRDAPTLLKNADTAMYRAKVAGGNQAVRYAPAMNASARQLLELEADLHEAVRQRSFVVYYQPQVEPQTRRIAAVEALVRWPHPRRGLVPPGEFIGLAEERGLINALDTCVLTDAAAQCKGWENAGLPPLRIGVNMSAHEFRGNALVDMVARVLEETGADPRRLELELTETAAMQEPERVAGILGQLRKFGVSLSLDDFGTGYSSWTHLKHFPVSRLKIDRSFVSGLPRDRHDAAIVSATIEMAHLMDMDVTAEGVETEAQARFLIDHGCDLLQGFLYSAARPADEITEALELGVLPSELPVESSVA